MISIALLGNLQYNYSLPPDEESELLICSWNHKKNANLMVALVINQVKAFKVRTVDLFASDTTTDTPVLRIGINFGIQEIFDAIEIKAPDLLDIIKFHNPDIEELLGQHPSFERQEIETAAMPGIAISVSTKSKRL